MASEDKLDHEFYDDTDGDKDQESGDHKQGEADQDYDIDLDLGGDATSENGQSELKPETPRDDAHHTNGQYSADHNQQPITSTDDSVMESLNTPRQAPQEQGLKRKGGVDERPMDPGATTALLISDLSWWHTEDDIRGWVNQAGVEDELKEVTFSEHKVNGKSKGQAFADFSSPHAATASKHKIDLFTTGPQNTRKHNVTYTNPLSNPFKTLPKDGPQRGKDDRGVRSSSAGYSSGGPPPNNFGSNNFGGGGYRGGRGGYNNRGASNMGGGYNRNFSGGFQGPPRGGGFQGSPMSTMQQNYGGFNQNGMMGGPTRGNPGGMRGGRGGMGGPNNNLMAMGNMGSMGNIGGPMGMGQMGMGNMNPMMNMGGFQGGNTHFNPAFFPQNTAGADGSWNPHGAKRTRQD